MSNARKVVVVGGVAGGMSCAARARRLSEDSQIIVFERGPHVSFANCGLPYHVGREIPDAGKLLVQTPQKLHRTLNLDVRILSDVIAINRESRTVTVKNLSDGTTYDQAYDSLVLSVGAAPLRPPIPGIDRPGCFSLRNIPDMERIIQWIDQHKARKAVVVGGGYIGLEMAEQLHRRGINVAIAEAQPQVMAPLDPEMAEWLHLELESHGISLHLNDGVASFEAPTEGETGVSSTVVLKSGVRLPADVVIMGLGVRPDIAIAREAGLEVGTRGGLRVDDSMRTSDPAIWAVGDAVEVKDRITGEWAVIPLAGPANRQGRMVADNIFGASRRYLGTQGTAILRLFRLAAACTGANEKTLKRVGIPYEAIHLHPGSHAGYFPGAKPIAMKVLFDPATGRLLGAQAVGEDGVDKRMDVFATAIAGGLTVDDLAELELAYAPPFGSAKDPVNMAGMIGQNVREGIVVNAQWDEVGSLDPAQVVILDVREPGERAAGALPNSINIPLGELRARYHELDRNRELLVHCQTGLRSYLACRILMQKGFKARNLAGAWRTLEKGRHRHR